MAAPIRRNGLWDPGPVKDGQRMAASYTNQQNAGAIREIIPGPGINVMRSGQRATISATGAPARIGGSGGVNIQHEDLFPAIPTALTLIELGGYVWHAMTGDTVWNLMSFVFTDATGVVGTDENGDTPP